MRHSGRRWLRWIALGLLTVVALALLRILAYRIVGARLLARERARAEAVFGSLDLDSLREAPVAEHENAVTAVRDVLAEMDLEAEAATWPRIDDAALLPEDLDLPGLEAQLAGVSPTLDRLATAARLPTGRFGTFDSAPAVEADALVPWIRAARLSHLDGAVALHRDDTWRLERSLATLRDLAATMRRGPVILHALVGNALEGFYLDLLRAAIAAGPDSEQLADWRQQVESLRGLPGTIDVLRGELGYLLASVAAAEKDDSTPFPAPTGWYGLLTPVSEDHLEAGFYRAYRELAERVVSGVHDRTDDHSERDPPAWRRTLDPTLVPDGVASILLPNLMDAIEKFELAATVEGLAAITLHLAQIAIETGTYPEALVELESRGIDLAIDRRDIPSYRMRSDGRVELRLVASRRHRLGSFGADGDEVDESTSPGTARWVRLCVWSLPLAKELTGPS